MKNKIFKELIKIAKMLIAKSKNLWLLPSGEMVDASIGGHEYTFTNWIKNNEPKKLEEILYKGHINIIDKALELNWTRISGDSITFNNNVSENIIANVQNWLIKNRYYDLKTKLYIEIGSIYEMSFKAFINAEPSKRGIIKEANEWKRDYKYDYDEE